MHVSTGNRPYGQLKRQVHDAGEIIGSDGDYVGMDLPHIVGRLDGVVVGDAIVPAAFGAFTGRTCE